VYYSWPDCQAQVSVWLVSDPVLQQLTKCPQVHGYRGAQFESFKSLTEAQSFAHAAVSSPSHSPHASTSHASPITGRDDHKHLPERREHHHKSAERSAGATHARTDLKRSHREETQVSSTLVVAELSVRAPKRPFVQPDLHLLRFDGGSRGNPGIGGSGAVLLAPNGSIIQELAVFAGDYVTNNEAEYKGLLAGLKAAYVSGVKHLLVEGDSLLVINQMTKVWRIGAENLVPLHAEAFGYLECFDSISFKHIPREENSIADALANRAMDAHLRIRR
jgi:ribonuclease HI